MRNVYFQPQTKEVELLPLTQICDLEVSSGPGLQQNAMAPRRLV